MRGLILLGSRARSELPADEWSDTDLLVFTSDADRWLRDGRWLDEIGPVILSFIEPTALGGLFERRVLFENAVDMDLVMVPLEITDEISSNDGAMPVLARGYRLLVDKDGRFHDLESLAAGADPRAVHGAEPWPPSPDHVANLINDYLYHCVWVTKKLRRGELAVAVACQNAYQGSILRRFVEWQAEARSEGGTNTYYEGRFLERWAVPETVAGLAVSQARYDAADLAGAIPDGMELFRVLATEVAAAVGVVYPMVAHDSIRDWLQQTLRA